VFAELSVFFLITTLLFVSRSREDVGTQFLLHHVETPENAYMEYISDYLTLISELQCMYKRYETHLLDAFVI
jgi:hypothetical protein